MHPTLFYIYLGCLLDVSCLDVVADAPEAGATKYMHLSNPKGLVGVHA